MCKTDLEYALHPKRKSCHLSKIKKYSYVYMCAIYTRLFWSGMLYDDSWCLHNKAICFETTEPMSIVLFIVQDGLCQQICKETTILTLVERWEWGSWEWGRRGSEPENNEIQESDYLT